MSIQRLLLPLLVSLFCASCAMYESTVKDVNSTRYKSLDSHQVGSGSIFIMTSSYANKSHPAAQEALMISHIEQRFKNLGYQITSDPKKADFIFTAVYGLDTSSVSNYHRIGDTVHVGRHYVHYVAGQLHIANRGTAGNRLWEGNNLEVWGHPKVDTNRMTRVLMQKFPN